MNRLRLRADKPRRALPPEQVVDGVAAAPAGSRLRRIVKRTATVVVVSGIAIAGVSAFTASSTGGAGIAFAAQGLAISSIPAVQAASATSSATSISDLAAARSAQLVQDGDTISDSQQSAAAEARSSALDSEATLITKEIDRLENLPKFIWPTAGTVSSPFGMRMHPILHYMRMHDGDDIGGKCGQEIHAAQSGVVVKAEMGYNGGSGNNVWIEHGKIDGIDVQSGYLHMEKYIVKVGEKVDQGDVIGYVGSTGLSTACHLHFSIKRNGVESDPMTYIGWNKEAKEKGDGHGE
ncbi:MAG: M23 family metallopeptidase [Propionicimonas sp.]|uniref:M23 family metallopeptidase n=1 Tax=Propionicimonas sp. TaxID=1955623 RepID=UPI003D0B257C